MLVLLQGLLAKGKMVVQASSVVVVVVVGASSPISYILLLLNCTSFRVVVGGVRNEPPSLDGPTSRSPQKFFFAFWAINFFFSDIFARFLRGDPKAVGVGGGMGKCENANCPPPELAWTPSRISFSRNATARVVNTHARTTLAAAARLWKV